MPPEPLAAPLTSDVITGEELAEDAAVGETADPVSLLGDLGHFESPHPRPLVTVPDVYLGSGCQGRPRVQTRCLPPAVAHGTIVLMLPTW